MVMNHQSTTMVIVMNHQSTAMVMVTNHQPMEATNPLKDHPIQQQLLKMRAADVKTKGQFILKCRFGAFKSPKKPTNFFQDVCPSLQKRSNQKNKCTLLRS